MQVHHHLVSVNAFGVSRKVFNDGGLCELSAHLHATVKHGVHVCASGIYGGGVSRGAATNDEAANVFFVVHRIVVGGVLCHNQ